MSLVILPIVLIGMFRREWVLWMSFLVELDRGISLEGKEGISREGEGSFSREQIPL